MELTTVQTVSPGVAAGATREIKPGYGELRNLAGNMYLALGDRDRALLEYESIK